MPRSPKSYDLRPVRGQALLDYQGRIRAAEMPLYEAAIIEEIRPHRKIRRVSQSPKIAKPFRNSLLHGDCMSVCAWMKNSGIAADLVYIDPPFASGANYAKTIYLRNGGQAVGDAANSLGEEILYADIWQKEDYLNWLYERLLAICEVMTETASIYVHLDWHIGHYAKILMDEVFGEENFRNEIIWHHPKIGVAKKQFTQNTDSIFFYSKGEEYQFSPIVGEEPNEIYSRFERLVRHEKLYYREMKNVNDSISRSKCRQTEKRLGRKLKDDDVVIDFTLPENKKRVDDVWKFSFVKGNSEESTGYATQKPEAILERIIKASSNEGDVVVDFFCGSGTTAKAANDLGRYFIAADVSDYAIQTTRDRLCKAEAEFDILKVQDGIRMFRNPEQTAEKIFSLMPNFQSRAELGYGEFWDGGIIGKDGGNVPLKFIGFGKKLTESIVDAVIEEVIEIDAGREGEAAAIIYAHKSPAVDQSYIDRRIRRSKRVAEKMKIRLMSIDDCLGEKADGVFAADSAIISREKTKDGFRVKIEKFYSVYLARKIDDFNAARKQGKLGENAKAIKISESGLELIEAVQFDARGGKDKKSWRSDAALEDRASKSEKIKGEYMLSAADFRIKIRSIAGDEIIISSDDIGG